MRYSPWRALTRFGRAILSRGAGLESGYFYVPFGVPFQPTLRERRP